MVFFSCVYVLMIFIDCKSRGGGGHYHNRWVQSPLLLVSARFCGIVSIQPVASTTRMKGPQRFWPHGSDCSRSLTLTWTNSPCWRSCECCNNFLSSLWPPLLAIDWAWLPRGMCYLEQTTILSLRYGKSEPGLQRLPGVRLPLVNIKF